ncbi:hypothetical protein RND71_018445 [Anisodus tanguticus]|uniref:Uncharacterized protein n=1 Tax=Anisodus tanguticus TaxID=243964 RepID=A0AAE1VJC8_9SOLA|nr:hypothetical protein RND71_018445 [Anisodus tanguticus]
MLYETCQNHKLKVRVVDMWSHDGSFEVFIDNQLSGKGMCHVKKEIALNRAANKAYNEVIRILSVRNMKIANKLALERELFVSIYFALIASRQFWFSKVDLQTHNPHGFKFHCFYLSKDRRILKSLCGAH